MRSGGLVLALLGLGCTAPPRGPTPDVGQARGGRGQIVVEIVGLRSSEGQIKCDLFELPDGFPTQSEKASIALKVKIEDKRATCVFEKVVPGTYAVAFLHDENMNDQMDTNFIGMPKEGQGASNNAHGSLGPPKFEDAAFNYRGGKAELRLIAQY